MKRPRAAELWQGLRFAGAVARAVRRPFTQDEARRILGLRLRSRAENFLELVRRTVVARPESPYARLLAHGGLDSKDVTALVRRDGLEGGLAALFEAGVYLTVDEFKGRAPVVRGSLRFSIEPSSLDNPLAPRHLSAASGGSRGRRTPVPIGLPFIRDHAVNTFLTLAAHGGAAEWRHANWGVPGSEGMINVLEFCLGGAPPARWFWQLEPREAALDPAYEWGASALRGAARVAGVRLPGPEHVPLADPLPIVRWMSQVLRGGETPHLWTYASSALRVCQAALEAGVNLTGAHFTAGGEPLTAARRAVIERTGARVAPRYGATETDIIGYACARPAHADDQHFLDDRRAVIQPGPGARPGRLPEETLLFTSLLQSDPLILLNVSLGDQASLDRRACGCPLERLGWASHLHQIRSFEKLSAAGMTFLDGEVIRVLDEVLPARFGGVASDYQLVEETIGALPRLRLLVHPRLAPRDPAAIASGFLDALAEVSGSARVMAQLWRSGDVLEVELRSPRTTPTGKVLHVHHRSLDPPD